MRTITISPLARKLPRQVIKLKSDGKGDPKQIAIAHLLKQHRPTERAYNRLRRLGFDENNACKALLIWHLARVVVAEEAAHPVGLEIEIP